MVRNYGTKKKKKKKNFFLKVWDTDAYNIIISKSFKKENNSICLIGYLDDAIRPLGLI